MFHVLHGVIVIRLYGGNLKKLGKSILDVMCDLWLDELSDIEGINYINCGVYQSQCTNMRFKRLNSLWKMRAYQCNTELLLLLNLMKPLQMWRRHDNSFIIKITLQVYVGFWKDSSWKETSYCLICKKVLWVSRSNVIYRISRYIW